MIKRSTRTKKKDMRQVAFTRFMLVVAVFVVWIGGIGVRLVHLQVNQHTWLREKALDMRQDVKQTKALRGTIFDRNERALAMSLRVKTLYADMTEIDDVDGTAKTVAKTLNLNLKQLATQLKQGKDAKKRFVPIAKKLDEDLAAKINKSLDTPGVKKFDTPNFTGLHWREDQKRSYPYGSLAAQVVGFSNADDDGKAGVEMSQDDVLHGAIIKKVQERDRLGRVYDETTVERDAPSDVVLTIESAYQYMAEQALERGVKNAEAKSGLVVAMDPRTGEILAMANYPTFDPNTITEANTENIGNKAVQNVYSPGSTFKIVTYGSALERHLFSPDDEIDAGNGTITVADHKFTDSHAVGRVSYSQALAHSSNVCAIKTGLRVGREDFYGVLQKMGFGAKTGIELPAETGGIVRSPDKWNGDSLASMSIGYEVGVSALQMTSAFATIANDGVRSQPHIVKEIRHSDEQPKTITQTVQSQVITADTARSLRTMLKQVVLTGTGKRAQLNGYSVAGKTGTAWKVDAKSKSVDSSKYISSFIGMAPADNPSVVIAVVIDEPKVGARDGGMVAAPVFRELAQNLLTEMKVPTDAQVRQDVQTAQDIPESPAKTKADAKAVDVKTETASKEKPAAKDKPKEIKEVKKPVDKIDKKGKANARLTPKRNRREQEDTIIET